MAKMKQRFLPKIKQRLWIYKNLLSQSRHYISGRKRAHYPRTRIGCTYSPPRRGGGIASGNRVLCEADAAPAGALWTMPHLCGAAVASSAYLSCTNILNDYDAVRHDYTRKKGLVWREVFLPEFAPPEWKARGVLWNAVEENEKTKESRRVQSDTGRWMGEAVSV